MKLPLAWASCSTVSKKGKKRKKTSEKQKKTDESQSPLMIRKLPWESCGHEGYGQGSGHGLTLHFTWEPLNSPVVLLHWRAVLLMVSMLSGRDQRQFQEYPGYWPRPRRVSSLVLIDSKHTYLPVVLVLPVIRECH
jgi:hypothetical protein